MNNSAEIYLSGSRGGTRGCESGLRTNFKGASLKQV